MKIPVKECTLCGALIRAEGDAIAKHRQFHKTTPARPRRTTVGRPPVLEEPSRRPPVFEHGTGPYGDVTRRLPVRRRKVDQALFADPPRAELGKQFGS